MVEWVQRSFIIITILHTLAAVGFLSCVIVMYTPLSWSLHCTSCCRKLRSSLFSKCRAQNPQQTTNSDTKSGKPPSALQNPLVQNTL